MKSKIVWTIVFGFVTIVACQAKPTPQTTKAASQLSAIWHDEVVTFTDPLFGLSMDLPPDWYIIPHPITETQKSIPMDIFYSPCENRGLPFVAPPCTKILISVIPSPIHSFEELKARAGVSDVMPSRVVEQRELNLNGLPAVWTTIESMNVDTSSMTPMVAVLIWNGKQGLYLNAYGELSPISSIVATIRPIRY
jgi:hypothetical protein